jgi:two-component system, NarL family, response regulator NreC
MIKVLITDDHETYAEGLALLLNKQEDINVCDTVFNSRQLLEKLPVIDIDIILLDLYLPNTDPEALIQDIRKMKPHVKVMYLTMMRGTRFVHRLLRYNIQGYILKNTTTDELMLALRTVAEGKTYFSREVDIREKDSEFRQMINIHDSKIADILTPREMQILELICKEYSNAEIAEKLFLSVSTIETHRKKIISKLGVNNTVGLVKFALKNNIID